MKGAKAKFEQKDESEEFAVGWFRVDYGKYFNEIDFEMLIEEPTILIERYDRFFLLESFADNETAGAADQMTDEQLEELIVDQLMNYLEPKY